RLAEPTRGRIVTLSSRLGRAHTTQHQGQSLVVVKPPRCRTWLGSARYASWIALLSAVAALELLAAAAPARVVAADLVALADHPLLRRHSPAPGFERARRGDRL